MRILVTGGNSFIGGHLIRELMARGHELHATLRSTDEKKPPFDLPLSIASLDEPKAWVEVMRRVRPDCILHLAALTMVTHADEAELYRTNVVGTENVLKAIGEVPGLRPHLILTSTSGVYGNQTAELLEETMPARPVNHYALSKLAMEYLARQYAELYPIRIIRPFNVIGPGQNEAFLVPKIVKHFVDRAPELQLGNLKPERDFVDVRDFASVVASLAELVPPTFDVVNISSGVGVSVAQLLDLLTEVAGYRPAVTINPKFVRQNEVWRIVGDNRKLLGLVKQRLRFGVGDTLRSMVASLNDVAGPRHA